MNYTSLYLSPGAEKGTLKSVGLPKTKQNQINLCKIEKIEIIEDINKLGKIKFKDWKVYIWKLLWQKILKVFIQGEKL